MNTVFLAAGSGVAFSRAYRADMKIATKEAVQRTFLIIGALS
jgi:hypothetical protein